ncbi:MAG: hypothetical protein ACRD8A_03495 [Candidatus Acidiferrales bacterium]
MATLVEKIAGIVNASEPATLKINNVSLLNEMDASTIEQALESQMSKRLRLAPPGTAATQITITLSEGAVAYIWVAQVASKISGQTVMVSIAKQASNAARAERPAMNLQRKLIWSQPQPFLDFDLPDGVAANGPGMIVLESASVNFYSSVNGQWASAKSIPLKPALIPPRGARGMIWQSGEEIDMFVPGESCSGVVATLPELVCAPHPSTNPAVNWPLVTASQRQDAQFESNRNFFAGMVSVSGAMQSAIPPFYTAAARSTADGTNWLVAGVDGKAKLFDAANKLIATFSGWGDQVATIDTGCDDSWQVLTTGADDSMEPDHIQIYDIRNYSQPQASTQSTGSQTATAVPEVVAVGQPLDFSGPILAMWSAADLKSARVVSLNLQMGMYEGSIISVSCGE